MRDTSTLDSSVDKTGTGLAGSAMRYRPRRAAQRVQRADGVPDVIASEWAARIARELAHIARQPGEDDQVVVRRLIGEACDLLVDSEARMELARLELEELVQLVLIRVEQERDLCRQRIAAAEAVLEADKERRSLERRARQAETRVRRAIEGARPEIISRHLLIDPEAWQALAREARRRRTTLATLAGEAIAAQAARLVIGDTTVSPPTRRQRRSPRQPEPQPADRVARLRLASEAWATIADAAAASGTTAARQAGEILEAAAQAIGWRSG